MYLSETQEPFKCHCARSSVTDISLNRYPSNYLTQLWLINDDPWIGIRYESPEIAHTVYPKKYAHGFVVLCFVVVMQSFIMHSHEVFIHIHQGCFAGTGTIVRLPQCQWSKPDGYGKISQCITTTKHSKAKTVCILLGIYCIFITLHAVLTHPRPIESWTKWPPFCRWHF